MPEPYAQGSTTLLSWVLWEVQPLNEVLRARSQVRPACVIRPSICLPGGRLGTVALPTFLCGPELGLPGSPGSWRSLTL